GLATHCGLEAIQYLIENFGHKINKQITFLYSPLNRTDNVTINYLAALFGEAETYKYLSKKMKEKEFLEQGKTAYKILPGNRHFCGMNVLHASILSGNITTFEVVEQASQLRLDTQINNGQNILHQITSI